jgi:hypothetical protein
MSDPGAYVPIKPERTLRLLVLTRFLHANRHPLRSKTLWVINRLNAGSIWLSDGPCREAVIGASFGDARTARGELDAAF